MFVNTDCTMVIDHLTMYKSVIMFSV